MDELKAKELTKEKEYRHLISYLRSGKVVMMPTDTIYGFSCRADDRRAIERIFSIKSRDRGKPLLVLVSSLAMVKRYCHINKKQEIALKKTWQGTRPSSVLLTHRGLLPPDLTAKSSELALRLPKSVFLRKIVRSVGVPLVSTSANISGQELLSEDKARQLFKKNPRPDLLISGGKNSRLASRLIRLKADGSQEIIRE